MGGTVGVRSDFGRGSSFWFDLTLPVAGRRSSHLPPADTAGLRVLVVDDIEINRTILREQAESWGMVARVAATGDDAIALMREAAAAGSPFDVAILDGRMPGMGGEDLAIHIKADPAISPTRLILLTSVGAPGDAARLRSLGFAGYLTKPARSAQVLETISAVCGRHLPAKQHGGDALARVADRTARLDEEASYRILLAEDSHTSTMVVSQMLEDFPCELVEAGNGLDALERFARESFDLVLMDVSMPVMDGYEATRAIRSAERRMGGARVPVIGLTAHVLDDDRERCLDAGMDDFMAKPIHRDALVALLTRWLARTAEDDERLLALA